MRKSALRIRIAIGAPTSTKQRQLKPFAHRRHGSITIRLSRLRSFLSNSRSWPVNSGVVASIRPVSIPIAVLPATSCSMRSIFFVCSTRAVANWAIAISEGLVEVVPLRLTASRGSSRTIVSGNDAV